MNYQQEYKEELQKVQDRDFTHSWVSSSGFLFYLQLAFMLLFFLAASYIFYTRRFNNLKLRWRKAPYTLPSTNRGFKIFFKRAPFLFLQPLSSFYSLLTTSGISSPDSYRDDRAT